ncbi:methylthioribose kinase [Chloropicon primus]|uniref:Methylthioribose-1-phosphate isomerase n=1 Tax=Chloropicon primus TaxID=1764295 RepID=A0A5B8MN97_9CHLO|nr:methylthioribose kinase [Chloropicon primus]UPR01213.1 methylthioribose kinase [Chloropicon primus]|eukprot:QDZ21993.1 methylthioribose kinase [Chloropicon primus]
MAPEDHGLRAIIYERDGASGRATLKLLDQRVIPYEKTYLDVRDSKDGWTMINSMVVRGAPAIAIAGVLSLAVELANADLPQDPSEMASRINEKLTYLVTSRPTAVNLAIACGDLKQRVARAGPGATSKDLAEVVIAASEELMRTDTEGNLSMGSFGSKAIQEACRKRRSKDTNLRVLTHCNTGALATSSYGTALGVVRSLHSDKVLERAYCTETRPYNQGARLTAYELVHDKIPSTLVTDSTAPYLMSKGEVDAVVLGADRIAANGDVANKIGTYSLAVSASYSNVPFFVAAPVSTVDLSLPNGSGIPIEERSSEEMTHLPDGKRVVADGIGVWNPAFDVTPAPLIAGIITEYGTVWPNSSGEFDMKGFIDSAREGRGGSELPMPLSGAKGFTEEELKRYIQGDPDLKAKIPGDASTWSVKEVGDGNINFVFIVEGGEGRGMVVKQALPYVRCIGESWPLTADRAMFETTALVDGHEMCPDHVPQVYKFDKKVSAIFMEYLAPPNIILRYGLIDGVVYLHLADCMSTFLAATLFKSSLFALPSAEYRKKLAFYADNSPMCELTEQVIFTDPYGDAFHNRHNSPYLDADVADLRRDAAAKDAISELKAKFCTQAQALLHGDLHTGSVMVTQDTVSVIDPEFAFYGPMGFDIGAFISNLFLAFFASDGHETGQGEREEHRAWLIACCRDVWNLFQNKFLKMWNEKCDSSAYPELLFGAKVQDSDGARRICQETFMRQVFEDTLGFAGAKMIRRIVGVAHVQDMDRIEDAKVRADCEKRALKFGKRLLIGRATFESIEEVVSAASELRRSSSSGQG